MPEKQRSVKSVQNKIFSSSLIGSNIKKSSWNYQNINKHNLKSPTNLGSANTKKDSSVSYFINLQDFEIYSSTEDQGDYKILKLPKNKNLDKTQKDSKMVFDVFNRNIYNKTYSSNKKKPTMSKSRSKKKTPSLFMLSNCYNKQALKSSPVKPVSPSQLKSLSLTENNYKTSMLTISKKKEEASSSRIFRMESFLNNIEKLSNSTTIDKVGYNPEKEWKKAKEKKFFPNRTLMATCNKIFDICKLDTSTGFFNFNKTGHHSEIHLFSKTKIRKKNIRDNFFSFKSKTPKKIDLPASISKIKPASQKACSISSSQTLAELNMLSSNSEIYWNQKINEIESTHSSCSSSFSTEDDEVVRINEEKITSPVVSAQHVDTYKDGSDKCKLFEDELGIYNYSEYNLADVCSLNLIGKMNKKREEAVLGVAEDHTKYLNIIVHRLPGEKLGMSLRVEESGHIVVINVVENGAANRASDLHGNSCPIMANDRIVEINGVSLHIMKDEDLLSIVQELPLYVQLTLYRTNRVVTSPTLSLMSPNEGNSIFTPPSTRNVSPDTTAIINNVPMGYNIHTVYLSSLEAKCIMPCDIVSMDDKINGYFKILRSTLMIANEDDHLKKGDILFAINGEQLHYKNKFELCSILSSLSGIAEICVLRKSTDSCCFTGCDYEVPYYNGIFAQNSIKLAMRKYENPGIKSGSDVDFQGVAGSGKETGPVIKTVSKEEQLDTIDSMISENLNSLEMSSLRVQKYDKTLTATTTDTQYHVIDDSRLDLDEKSENYSELVSSINGQIINSLHKGNWIFLDKRQLNNYHSGDTSPVNNNTVDHNKNIKNNSSTESVKFHLADIQTRVSEKLEQSLKNQSIRSFVSDTQKLQDLSDFFLENLFRTNEASASAEFKKEDQSFSNSARSLTSSSCHSERSIARLNCLTLFDDESKANVNLIDLSDVNMFITESKENLGSAVESTLDEIFSHVESEDGDDGVTELIDSMVKSVEDKVSIEKEIYKLLVELVNEIEMRYVVGVVVEDTCASVEKCDSMVKEIESSVESIEVSKEPDDKVEIQKEVIITEVKDNLEEIEKDKRQLKNSSFSSSLSKIIKEDEELCSLKKLIHEELKELIRSKSHIEETSACHTPQSSSASLADLSINQEHQHPHHKATKQTWKPKPSSYEKNDDNLNLTQFVNNKILLKSTAQNFLHKHKPTVIYNSIFNHRNMPQTPPPPIPNTPLTQKTLFASNPMDGSKSAQNCQQTSFKSHMKNSNLVFDSESNGNKSNENLSTPSSSCNSEIINQKKDLSNLDQLLRPLKETKNGIKKYSSCESSEMLKLISPHLIDDQSGNLVASRALSTTCLHSPTIKTKESPYDYVKSAIEKQTKQQCYNQQLQQPRQPLNLCQHLSYHQLSLNRSISPLAVPRKKFESTTNLFKPTDRQQKPQHQPLAEDPNTNNNSSNTDDLSASSVREKIKIFTKNPVLANNAQVNKAGVLNRVKKVFNPLTSSPQQHLVKPRPLSQVITENRLQKLNDCISDSTSKLQEIIKSTQPITKLTPVAQVDVHKTPEFDNREVKLNHEEAANETEKTFKSVKEKIAYFSSKLYLEKSGQQQKPAKSEKSGAKEGKFVVQKNSDKISNNCLIEAKPKLSTVGSNNRYFTETSSSSSSVHYASYHNLNNFNVIYNQVSQHTVKYGESGWKSNISLNCGKKSMMDTKIIDGSENKISSLIENLETKWKQRGLNN